MHTSQHFPHHLQPPPPHEQLFDKHWLSFEQLLPPDRFDDVAGIVFTSIVTDSVSTEATPKFMLLTALVEALETNDVTIELSATAVLKLFDIEDETSVASSSVVISS